MMKPYFFSILMAALSGFVQAQVSLRPQAGVTAADFSYTSLAGAVRGGSGFIVGADLQIGSPFYVQPGLLLSRTNLSVDGVGNIYLTELNVPVMAGYKLFADKGPTKFGLRIFAGPDFQINVNKKIDEVFSDLKKEDFNDFLVSGVVGIGVDVLFLFLDLDYSFGLSDYITTDRANAKVDYATGTLGLRIGF
jgi:hypothetical protein